MIRMAGALILAAVFLAASGVRAQQPGAAFDVASVKPNKTGDRSSTWRDLPGGQFEAINITLASLILQAYDVMPFQVTGGPGWMAGDAFDILAKAPEGGLNADGRLRPEVLQQMLRALLADRFGLAAHTETRDLPIYLLVMAREDKRLGPQLKAYVDCAPAPGCGGNPPGESRGGGSANARAGSAVAYTSSMRNSPVTMAAFTKSLSRNLGRMVLNRTGLDGRFDLSLMWNQNDSPTIFTALQEQLGLKLEAGRGPVEILVIDRAAPPREN
jgi:uncharacterized protein (TIGR03435 family)